MRWRSLILAFTLLPTLWAGGETIRVAVNEWSTLNPLLLAQDTDVEAVDLLFDRLITLDAQGAFVPELLESWTVSNGGRDVLLKLRPGMTWHDGRPIEAEDIVFTWNALRLPRVRKIADTVGGVTSFDSLKAEGPLAVKIRLARPRGSLLSDLYNFIPVPRHLYQVGPNPKLDAINFRPVGSGPYRVVGLGNTKRFLLERWPAYRGIHPGQAAAFEFLASTPDKNTVPAFEQGQLHFGSVAPLRYYLVRKGAQGNGQVQTASVSLASLGAYFLNCDPKLSLLGDVSLRQALAELVPWQELARARRFFPARLATGFWPPESFAYDPDPHPLPQVEKAVAMLEAAGWRLGPDGVRVNARGRRLELKAYETATQTKRSPLHLLVAQAERAGIRIHIIAVNDNDIFDKATAHEGDLWSYGWSLSLDPDVDSPLFTLEGYRTKANVCSYLNPEMDRLFDLGRHTLDLEARRQIYHQISEIIYRDKPIIPTSYTQSRVLIHRRLQGVAFNRLGQSFGFWPGRRGWRLDS